MDIVCSYTSDYFPIYDDDYKRVHYDEDGDDQTLHDIRGFADSGRLTRTTSSIMMGPGGANYLGTHGCTCESCVVCREVLHTEFCPD